MDVLRDVPEGAEGRVAGAAGVQGGAKVEETAEHVVVETGDLRRLLGHSGQRYSSPGANLSRVFPARRHHHYSALFAKGDSASPLGRLFPFGPEFFCRRDFRPRCADDRGHGEPMEPRFGSLLVQGRKGAKARYSFQPMNVYSMARRLIRLLRPQCQVVRNNR